MDVIPYTIWDLATGEICGTGTSVKGTAFVPENCAIWEGEALSPETHVFGEDGIPVLRQSPRLKTPHELNGLINRERARRIEAGKDFGGILVTGSDKDISNLTNLALGAQLRIGMGDTTTITVFRDGNNVDHEIAPRQMLELWMTASAYVSAIYQASWSLKAMEPIPQDVSADAYWP